jgi:hypothetical protein
MDIVSHGEGEDTLLRGIGAANFAYDAAAGHYDDPI